MAAVLEHGQSGGLTLPRLSFAPARDHSRTPTKRDPTETLIKSLIKLTLDLTLGADYDARIRRYVQTF